LGLPDAIPVAQPTAQKHERVILCSTIPTLRFDSHFCQVKLRMIEVVVTTGAIRHAKFRSNRHHQQTNTQLFTCQMPFLSLNQQCQSTEGISTKGTIRTGGANGENYTFPKQ